MVFNNPRPRLTERLGVPDHLIERFGCGIWNKNGVRESDNCRKARKPNGHDEVDAKSINHGMDSLVGPPTRILPNTARSGRERSAPKVLHRWFRRIPEWLSNDSTV